MLVARSIQVALSLTRIARAFFRNAADRRESAAVCVVRSGHRRCNHPWCSAYRIRKAFAVGADGSSWVVGKWTKGAKEGDRVQSDAFDGGVLMAKEVPGFAIRFEHTLA